jgi:hypothetical protein
MKTHQVAGILAFAAILGACADATLSVPETRTPPTGAAFNTGVGFGSGGFTQDTASNEPMITTTECTMEDGRTGVGFGSGGRTDTCTAIDQQ